jgi:DNA-binding transcriptional ArsR family regulator
MEQHATMLAALGHPLRLEIFRSLVRAGETGRCVDEIKTHAEVPGSTLSHHLDALQRCGLIMGRRAQRFIFYSVNWPNVRGLLSFLTEDCCAEARPNDASRRRAARSKPR